MGARGWSHGGRVGRPGLVAWLGILVSQSIRWLGEFDIIENVAGGWTACKVAVRWVTGSCVDEGAGSGK